MLRKVDLVPTNSNSRMEGVIAKADSSSNKSKLYNIL